MKQLAIILVITLLTAGACWAVKSDLQVDGKGIRLQACAPRIANGAVLTGNSQTISVDGANCWKVYVAADTKFRAMSTATKVGVQHTIPGGSWYTDIVSNYKFVNFSGASGTFRSDK